MGASFNPGNSTASEAHAACQFPKRPSLGEADFFQWFFQFHINYE